MGWEVHVSILPSPRVVTSEASYLASEKGRMAPAQDTQTCLKMCVNTGCCGGKSGRVRELSDLLTSSTQASHTLVRYSTSQENTTYFFSQNKKKQGRADPPFSSIPSCPDISFQTTQPSRAAALVTAVLSSSVPSRWSHVVGLVGCLRQKYQRLCVPQSRPKACPISPTLPSHHLLRAGVYASFSTIVLIVTRPSPSRIGDGVAVSPSLSSSLVAHVIRSIYLHPPSKTTPLYLRSFRFESFFSSRGYHVDSVVNCELCGLPPT